MKSDDSGKVFYSNCRAPRLIPAPIEFEYTNCFLKYRTFPTILSSML